MKGFDIFHATVLEKNHKGDTMPTIGSKKTERTGLKSQKALARETKLLFIVVAAASASILLHLSVQAAVSWRHGARIEAEIKARKAARAVTVYENDLRFNQELEIAKNAASERIAERNHAAEMERRRAHDPKFAVSEREKAMLQMKGMSLGEGEAPEEFLKKLAKLACPPKSGVGVTVAKTGYLVEVAFPYSRITEAHSEYKKHLPGLYLEVKKTAAGIAQDILTYGGPLGVAEVVVRCQGVANVQTREGVKKEKRDLFGVTFVNDGRDWSQYSRTEMEQLWKINTNQFPAMIANMGAR